MTELEKAIEDVRIANEAKTQKEKDRIAKLNGEKDKAMEDYSNLIPFIQESFNELADMYIKLGYKVSGMVADDFSSLGAKTSVSKGIKIQVDRPYLYIYSSFDDTTGRLIYNARFNNEYTSKFNKIKKEQPYTIDKVDRDKLDKFYADVYRTVFTLNE